MRKLMTVIMGMMMATGIWGCGASTPDELKTSAFFKDEYIINEDIEDVFMMINKKIQHCNNIPFFRESSFYPKNGEGRIHFFGDFRKSLIVVDIKKIGDKKTKVYLYSTSNSLMFPSYIKTIKMGAYSIEGCP